jgi:Tannase and feruloyl esterase
MRGEEVAKLTCAQTVLNIQRAQAQGATMSKATVFLRFGLCPMLLSLPLGAATCDSLVSLKLTSTTITAAQVVAAGAFLPPSAQASLAPFKSLPAFCRVRGVIAASTDSHIEFEVWMPLAGWNGKYLGVGNQDLAGSISYTFGDMQEGANFPGLADLRAGYATSSTDAGHKVAGLIPDWVLGHPEKLTDYGFRAIHETAVRSKAIIQAFYGESPRHSYFNSCSNGGREALMEAGKFPTDYDGIIAGAPAASITHLAIMGLIQARSSQSDPAASIPESKLPAIETAVVKACDESDGLKDGLIGDPRRCRFDSSVLLCKGPESDACLTAAQIAALEKLRAPLLTSKGDEIYPSNQPGADWTFWSRIPLQIIVNRVGYLFFQNKAWDPAGFQIDGGVKDIDARLGSTLNADPNLRGFMDRGGKLILWHGWTDSNIPPTATVDYYMAVVKSLGRAKTEGFTRLYLAPGVDHCGGGPGPNSFGMPITAALERWVETGQAPKEIIATKYTDDSAAKGVSRTRPLCPYPQVARYRGSGSIDEAANFICRMP